VPAWRQAQERAGAMLGVEATAAIRRAVDGLWKEEDAAS
jgi:hypothetical protein